MRTFAALTAVFSVGCQDQNLKEFNRDPVAEIYSPKVDESIKEGVYFLASGLVSDRDDPTEQLLVTWFLNGEFRCADSTPMADGRTECGMSLGSEDAEIALLVVDPNEATYQASVQVLSIPASGPTITISEPSKPQYDLGQKIAFEGTVADGEDLATALEVGWRSDLDGELDIDLALDDDGSVSGHYDLLTVGDHVLRLWAMDTTGRTNSAEVPVRILPEPEPPSVAITQPESGATLPCDAPVFFQAVVADTRTPVVDLQVEWSSSRDGVFNTEASDTLGEIGFFHEGLSEGIHQITLTVTDSDEMFNIERISLTLSCATGSDDTGEAEEEESGDSGGTEEAD